MLGAIRNLFGADPTKSYRKALPTVAQINALEDGFGALDNNGLRRRTVELRDRLKEGATLDEILPEAFAAVRETAKRFLGMRHYDVQLAGGMVLHQGKIAEMGTGEGKTLVATLPAYLNALSGNAVHVVTVNDYLARRDMSWMGAVYNALGLTVSCIQSGKALKFDGETGDGDASNKFASIGDANLKEVSRSEAYACDIVYGTNNEFGFDYLRDNIATGLGALSRTTNANSARDFGFALVDEVDNILIDEARTPLIISGPAQDRRSEYRRYAQVARGLKEVRDYEVNLKERYVNLTQSGIAQVEKRLGIPDLYNSTDQSVSHFLDNALRAQSLFHRDREYVIKDGAVVLVDEHTGRLTPGRRLSEGLHQAIEAKEGVTVQRESMTFATITLQNYFRKYKKLGGMTGTALTESEEFYKIYKLDVVPIPTNRPDQRRDLPDQIFVTKDAKWDKIVEKIAELNDNEVPVLVGTTSIDSSDHLARLLRSKTKVKFNVLNARQHDKEAEIVAQAGSPGAVTVATNVAGRGTDIILGGNPEMLEIDRANWQKRHDQVVANGGLFVLGTERHESRRIDNQLRGRSGRQGDPGATQFFISLEDDLAIRFGGERLKRMIGAFGLGDDEALESKMFSRSIKTAQQNVEGHNFEIRRHLLEYDDVINVQRDVVYKLRRNVLALGARHNRPDPSTGRVRTREHRRRTQKSRRQWGGGLYFGARRRIV